MTPFNIQVQSVFCDVTFDEVETRLLSVIHSLTVARDAESVLAWKIIWGDWSANPCFSSREIAKVASLVAAAGGTFTHTSFSSEVRPAEVHNALASAATLQTRLLFLDGGVVVAPDTILRMAQALQLNVALVDARCIPLEKIKDFDHETGSTPWAWGGCLLADAAAFNAVGGFDPSVFPGDSGDVDLSRRIRLAGHDVVHQPGARAFCGDRFGPDMELLGDEQGQPAILETTNLVVASTQMSIAQRHGNVTTAAQTQEADSATGPFLSVVIRTQGTRLELLGDVLVCLAGQTCQDFDVVIVQHSTENDVAVRGLIASQPLFLRKRISLHTAVGGKRAVPLNVGVASAKGAYITFFDDDDLVSAGWVESFQTGATVAPGAVQRSQVATLRSRPTTWPGIPQEGFVSIGIPVAEYARSFSQIDHLLVSHTPFMSLAFPRALFSPKGLVFDETLWVCEDWDILLQASSMAPVNDVDELTGFYRRWTGLRNSYSDHEALQWRESEAKVIGRIRSQPFTLRGDSVDRIRGLLELETELHSARQLLAEQGLVLGSMSWRVTAPLRWAKSFLAKVIGSARNS